MQSVEIDGLKEIQKRLEGYPEAMKKRAASSSRRPDEDALPVRRRIGGQGYVANVQDQYVGSGGGYAAVRAKAKTYLHGDAAGYITNALENGHKIRVPTSYAMRKQESRAKKDFVPGSICTA